MRDVAEKKISLTKKLFFIKKLGFKEQL